MKKFLLILLLFSWHNNLLSKNLQNPYDNPKISSKKLMATSSESKIQALCKTHHRLGTEGEIGCAKYKWEQADRSLNTTYQKILAQTKTKQTLKLAQKDWLKRRNATCNSVY